MLLPASRTTAPVRSARTPSRRAAVRLPLCIGLLIAVLPAGYASARPSRHRPLAQTRPTITGATAVGHVLRAWSGRSSGAATFRYQWQRCNSNGRACKPTGVARRGRGDEHVLTRRDVGHRLRVTVIAHTARGATSSTSKPTRVIRTARATAHPTPAPGSPGSSAPTSPARNLTAYATGYDIYDNTPPGSPVTSNPVLHQVAGGTGTYRTRSRSRSATRSSTDRTFSTGPRQPGSTSRTCGAMSSWRTRVATDRPAERSVP